MEPELDAHLRMIETGVKLNGYVYSESEKQQVGEHHDLTLSFGGARPYCVIELNGMGGSARKLRCDRRDQYTRLVKEAH